MDHFFVRFDQILRIYNPKIVPKGVREIAQFFSIFFEGITSMLRIIVHTSRYLLENVRHKKLLFLLISSCKKCKITKLNGIVGKAVKA